LAKHRKTSAKDHDRARRLAWWQQAKFGMFIHWGIYSIIGRHEWAMVCENIPIREYEPLAQRFRPRCDFARHWARSAKQAGMKYMVMTTKHHDGFCLWDTATTDYSAARQGCRRDLVREYVEAMRAEGLGVGLYFSLMDWHHPDGQKCLTDPRARKRFVKYVHDQVRELCTNYGKIDILWFDTPMPLPDAKQWQSARLVSMIRRLQPDILINGRTLLPGDFANYEQYINYSDGLPPWESCITINDSWGYQASDDAWKTPKRIIRDLCACARGGGNYLLNVGPKADGTLPPESLRILKEVGRWLAVSGEAIYGADPCTLGHSVFSMPTRKGNKVYLHCFFWPGESWSLMGWRFKVKSAKVLATGQRLGFKQHPLRLTFFNCPKKPPQPPVTTIVVDCASPPARQAKREEVWGKKKRYSHNVTFK